MRECKCWFCLSGKPHAHTITIRWIEVTGQLLVPESLDPNDVVRLEACHMCGHIREKEES